MNNRILALCSLLIVCVLCVPSLLGWSGNQGVQAIGDSPTTHVHNGSTTGGNTLSPSTLTVASSAKLPNVTPSVNLEIGWDSGLLAAYDGSSKRLYLYDLTAGTGVLETGTGGTRTLAIDPSVVVTDVTGGLGLSAGGGPSGGTVTLNVGAGYGITATASAVAINPSVVVTNPAAGAGLTGGGAPSAGTSTLTVGQGTGITVNADDVAIDPAYVTTQPVAGAGLTGSGVNPNFAVGAGTGISVTTDAVAIDPTVVVTSVAAGLGLTGGGTPAGGSVPIALQTTSQIVINDLALTEYGTGTWAAGETSATVTLAAAMPGATYVTVYSLLGNTTPITSSWINEQRTTSFDLSADTAPTSTVTINYFAHP